jgi:hypothetical protein
MSLREQTSAAREWGVTRASASQQPWTRTCDSDECMVSLDGSSRSIQGSRRHLDCLLAQIEPAADALRLRQGEHGVTMTVNCIWWSRAGQGGPSLWPEQMSRMAALNLECTWIFRSTAMRMVLRRRLHAWHIVAAVVGANSRVARARAHARRA